MNLTAHSRCGNLSSNERMRSLSSAPFCFALSGGVKQSKAAAERGLDNNCRRLVATTKPANQTSRSSKAARNSSATQKPVHDLPSGPHSKRRHTRECREGGRIMEGTWTWRNYKIRYQRCGESGPPVLLIHGFGGNCDHWRKNLPFLGNTCQTYALDLLGYGYSDKPDPREQPPNAIYNFETWGQQIADFVSDFIRQPVLIICNSVGGLAGLQAAKILPNNVKAVQVHNISLRMLHITKQSRMQKLYVARLQKFMRETRMGPAFFGAVAKPKAVRNVLRECYGNKNAVTEELVSLILKPGLQPGAAQVFLDFISYSGGPLPEDLIKDAPCPVSILWGDKDPWEKVEWGRQFQRYNTVEEFVELPGVGHCPMDEAPEVVNPKMLAFVERHSI